MTLSPGASQGRDSSLPAGIGPLEYLDQQVPPVRRKKELVQDFKQREGGRRPHRRCRSPFRTERHAPDLATNYVGTIRVTQAFLPVLEANAPSVIANVLTLIALAPVPGMAGYSASKAAAHSLTQALRAELRGRGIRVVGAYPGGIDTDMLAGVEADKADPRVVAARIVAGIDAGETMIWPDDASAGAGSVYLDDPVRLEQMLAG